jgi:hypothetical protein
LRCWGEVYGDLLRAAGATERLMELLHSPLDHRFTQKSGQTHGQSVRFSY